MSEKELLASCIQYLKLKRIFHYRQNTGALVDKERGKFLRYGVVGGTDIVAVIKGKYIGIECKVGKNKQSPGQIEFEKNLVEAGGIYLIIRDVQTLAELL